MLGRKGDTTSMAKVARTGQAYEWTVHSVVVRVRDGPERVRAAYRLLLARESLSADGPALPAEEVLDAGRNLYTRLNRAPGA
jgi:hypothetical protein